MNLVCWCWKMSEFFPFFFLFACLPFNFNHYEISSRKVNTLYLQTNSANSWKWEYYSLRENTFCINTLWLFVTQQGFIQALASSQTFLNCFLSIYASNAFLQPGFVAFWLLYVLNIELFQRDIFPAPIFTGYI
jgi:hypothetical protein